MSPVHETLAEHPALRSTIHGRYLVTGGSGFLGINLVRLLLDQGLSVRSLDIAPFDYPERHQVDVILGDIRNADTVDQAMRRPSLRCWGGETMPTSSWTSRICVTSWSVACRSIGRA